MTTHSHHVAFTEMVNDPLKKLHAIFCIVKTLSSDTDILIGVQARLQQRRHQKSKQ